MRTMTACAQVGVIAGLIACGTAMAGDGVVGPGNCDEAGFSSVLAAVDAGGGGAITFDCGAAPLTIALTGYKSVSDAVTIDGGGVIAFDGGGSSPFFQVYASASLTLTRLALRFGNFNGIHPLENFGTLTLDRVMMSNNGVADSAIDNSGTLVVRRSQFFSNVVDGDGSGAVLRNDGGDATFEDSLIAGNTIVLGNGTGGAIAVVNGNLTLDGCNVSNNSAHDGGALYIAPTAGTVRIVGSVFDNNLAGYGAAIESWGSEVSIVHGRFTNGDATTGDGGAIWELSGAITVDFSTFDDNAATTTGGAISCYDGSITIGRSTLSRNYAETTGGGVYATCAFSAHDVTFTGNGAIVGGGAVYLATAVDSSITHATIDANSAPFGAGLYNDGASAGTLHVASSIVSSNEGGSCDGVLASDGWNLNDDTSCGGVFTATGDLMGVATPLKLLGDYGGPTHTQPPADGNPAIDRIALGDAACDPPTDQRGTPRPYGVACDVGAIEVRDSLFAGDFEP